MNPNGLPLGRHAPPSPQSQVPTGKGTRSAAYVLLGLAGFFLLMIPLMALDKTARPDTWVGGVMIAVLSGIPGALLLWRGRLAGAQNALVGYLTSRDRLPLTEIARQAGRPERQTEQLVNHLNQKYGLGLVYVPAERQFVVRSRVASAPQLPRHCPACGAPNEAKLLLAGERLKCPYCGALLG